MVSVITPDLVSAIAVASTNIPRAIVFIASLFSGFQSEPQVHVHAHGMIPVVRLDSSGKRIGGDIGADAGLQVLQPTDVPRVAHRVGSDAEGAAGGMLQLMF